MDISRKSKALLGTFVLVGLAILIGAIILWFARGPILDWFDQLGADADDDQAASDTDLTPDTAFQGDPA